MEFNRLLHWNILQEIERDFADKVREFLVIGDGGEGVLMVTEPDGEGYWFGEMKFGWGKLKKATKPTRLGVSNLVRMAHGGRHIVLLDGMGQIYTIGMNKFGQLGQGTVNKMIYFTPQPIASPQRFIEVRCGKWYSLALTEDGNVWAWGNNYYCQVGLPRSTSSIPSPRQISELDSHRVVAIECGAFHSLALTDQGQVYGWGDKHYGQLAQTGRSPQPTPVLLPSASPVTQIAAGYWHTLLLTEDGGVFACGANDFGQLGRPITSTIQANPILCKVPGLPPISQIASHFDTGLSIALSTDRRCFVWGECNKAKYPTPLQLPPFYSTIESPLSLWSTHQNTPHSVRIEVSKSTLTSDSGTQTDALFAPESLLPDLFELSLSFQCPDLQQLCLTRMFSTVSLSTCCPYYQLAERHQLSEIQTQVVKFAADNLVLVLQTEAFRSMDTELARKLTLAASDLKPQAKS